MSNLHSNGRIVVIRENLLRSASLEKLVESKNLNEAFAVLAQCGYNKDLLKNDFDKALSLELEKAISVFLDVCVDDNIRYMFLAKLNYHNAKALLKLKFTDSQDRGLMLYEGAGVETEAIANYIDGKEFGLSDVKLAEAIQRVLNSELKNSPREIDLILDKAMYGVIIERLKKINSKTLHNYIQGEIDFNNILMVLRSKKLGFELEKVSAEILPGGVIPAKILIANYNKSDKEILQVLQPYYRELLSSVNYEGNSLAELERDFDNYLLHLFNSKKNNINGVEPFVGYYLAKMNEVNIVKLVLIAIKHNLSKELLKQRLRNLYVL